jgi:putative ABC transport system permease protein
MRPLLSDLRHAARGLRRRPGLALTGLLTLAIGIGATTAMFSVVHATLLRPLPYDEPDRLMLVHLTAPGRVAPPGAARGPDGRIPVVWSYPKYQTFCAIQRVYSPTSLYRAGEWNLTDTNDPERLRGELVTADYLRVLGIAPVAGRDFRGASAEDSPAAPPVALLGYSLWTRRFNRDPNAIGRAIGLNRTKHTIIGVLPPAFRGLSGASEVWVPVGTEGAEALAEPWSHSYSLVARLGPRVSIAQAQGVMPQIGRQVDEAHPAPFANEKQWSAAAEPLDEARLDPAIRISILVLFGGVACVLLITCVNLANLLLERSFGRQREIAVRQALGAGRLRLVRMLLAESLVLALGGTAAGLIVARWGIGLFQGLNEQLLSGVFRSRRTGLSTIGFQMIAIDGTTLVFSAGLALATCLAFGLLPAWRASRPSLIDELKESRTAGGGRRARAAGALLVVSEIALSVVLLAGAGLMLRSFSELRAISPGFAADHVLTFRLSLPPEQYGREGAGRFFEQLLARARDLPGVESVGSNNCAPLSSACNGTLIWFRDRPPVPRGAEPPVGVHFVSPGYVETLGVPLLEGRAFTARDRAGQPKVVMVSKEAARRFWPRESPVGKPIAVGQGGFADRAEVVGVVGDVRYGTLDNPPVADVYIPVLQSARTSAIVFVKSRLSTAALVPALRRVVRSLDRDLPMMDVKTMDERSSQAVVRARLVAFVLAGFAAIALALAGIGIFGIMAAAVAARTREIGIRMALGADRGSVLRLVVGRGLTLSFAGLATGIAAAFGLTRILRTLMFQVEPTDPTTFASVTLLLLAVAVAACYLPARRATRIDPLAALRHE